MIGTGTGTGTADPSLSKPDEASIADRSEFRGARFEEDKTDQRILRAGNRKLACDRYISIFGRDYDRDGS